MNFFKSLKKLKYNTTFTTSVIGATAVGSTFMLAGFGITAGAADLGVGLKELRLNSEQIAKVYAFYVCGKNLPKNAGEILFEACVDAKKNPHVAQVKRLEPFKHDAKTSQADSNNFSFICSFDGDHYVVSTQTSPPTETSQPVFQIDAAGVVSQIIKGDTTVQASTCKMLFDKKSVASKKSLADNPVSVDVNSTELCFSYYPSAQAIDYRTPPLCAVQSEQTLEPEAASTLAHVKNINDDSATKVQSAPEGVTPSNVQGDAHAASENKPRNPASVDDAPDMIEQRQPDSAEPSAAENLSGAPAAYPESKAVDLPPQDVTPELAPETLQEVVIPENSTH